MYYFIISSELADRQVRLDTINSTIGVVDTLDIEENQCKINPSS